VCRRARTKDAKAELFAGIPPEPMLHGVRPGPAYAESEDGHVGQPDARTPGDSPPSGCQWRPIQSLNRADSVLRLKIYVNAPRVILG
jgi:hypothetical protein